MRFPPLTWGSSPVKASSLKTLADMTKYLRCHHVLQTNPCISTCCSWGHRRVKQNKTLWIKACLWKSAAVCEKGVMWEKAARSSVTGGEGWEGIRRGRELLGAFYALTMQTPCFTLYSGGSSLWWPARGGEATRLSRYVVPLNSHQKDKHPHFPEPDSPFLGFPFNQIKR